MFLSFFLSFDSFVASLALGLLVANPRKFRMSLLFGVCDGLAMQAGLLLQHGSAVALRSNYFWIAPVGMCLWILFVAFLVRGIVVRKTASSVVISLLPLVLSLDNFYAGLVSSEGLLSANAAPAVAMLSASFALAGFAVAAIVQNHIPRSVAIRLGVIILFLSPILF
jgi:putative Mn2+ efflux pump MntP